MTVNDVPWATRRSNQALEGVRSHSLQGGFVLPRVASEVRELFGGRYWEHNVRDHGAMLEIGFGAEDTLERRESD
jgi:hypothetical protein